MLGVFISILLVGGALSDFTDLHCVGNTSIVVHLFEWKWTDIEKECEFLAQAGYCAVQTSVVTENKYEVTRPWWERYQPVSYKISTRSGTEDQFASMVRTCNNFGVRIINDVVLNHMARGDVGLGVAGSFFNGTGLYYPAVPYNVTHFHTHNDCSEPSNQISNTSTSDDLRHCQLLNLPDLDQSQDYVRSKIVGLLDRLVDHGSVGFRVDAAKHIHPADLKYIYDNVKDVLPGGRPAFINEVVNTIPDAISSDEYYDLGLVTEFRYSEMIGEALTKVDYSKLCGVFQTLLREHSALLFIDNHDTQRGRERPGSIVLNYKTPSLYKRAQAFTLAAGYGTQRVMSSYFFQDTEAGPPADSNEHILDVLPHADGTCGNGWVCEHRWEAIRNIVKYSNLVKGSPLTDCQATANTVSFMRGDNTLFWMTSDDVTSTETILTNLTDGAYCDLMTDCQTKYVVHDSGNVTLTAAEDGIVVLVPDLSASIESSSVSTTDMLFSTDYITDTLTTTTTLYPDTVSTTGDTWSTDYSTLQISISGAITDQPAISGVSLTAGYTSPQISVIGSITDHLNSDYRTTDHLDINWTSGVSLTAGYITPQISVTGSITDQPATDYKTTDHFDINWTSSVSLTAGYTTPQISVTGSITEQPSNDYRTTDHLDINWTSRVSMTADYSTPQISVTGSITEQPSNDYRTTDHLDINWTSRVSMTADYSTPQISVTGSITDQPTSDYKTTNNPDTYWSSDISLTAVYTTPQISFTGSLTDQSTADYITSDHSNSNWATDVSSTADYITPSSQVDITTPTASTAPDWRRTVIFIQKQTSPGQDVFIRGGIHQSRFSGAKACETPDYEHNACVIPIRHRVLGIREPTPARDAWSQGDNYLDWFGPEPNQGKHGSQPAQGTPAQWTSSNPNGKYYDSLNTYGDHYWVVDVDMDCSKTYQGFFEFKGVLSNGWEVGTSLDMDCTGDGAVPFPYHAGNHIGRCGFINVYHYASGPCEIHAFAGSSQADNAVIG
ncbi:uncharacterized protein LOC106071375 [Biomphalaria glabrata]|uniref:alpha-amylase n=1 Tax=Biomphalaria glabrata TaxID=6526 RepID=A0A9W3B462_BIOGL|nr:uncharacterized protein LOC106071375 [Biomphalaria glabrata]